jgi:hypothetical protein
MDIERVGEAEYWINGHGRRHSTEHARQHARALGRRHRPHVVLRHHRLRKTNEATILAIVNVDMPDLTGPLCRPSGLALRPGEPLPRRLEAISPQSEERDEGRCHCRHHRAYRDD